VDNALSAAADVEKLHAKLGAVVAQGSDHALCEIVLEWFNLVFRRNNVIDRSKGAIRVSNRQPEIAKHAESLWTRDLVNEVRTDEKLRLSVGQSLHGVGIPDFFK
jgi:hypothetical protein